MKEGVITNKDVQEKEDRIPWDIKKDLIHDFFMASMLIFIFIFIPVEIILGHLRIFEVPPISLFGIIIMFGLLFYIMIQSLKIGLFKYRYFKKHLNYNINELEERLKIIDENLTEAVSSKRNKRIDKLSTVSFCVMVILFIALVLSIGVTEEGYWYMTELSTFISGLYVAVLGVLIYLIMGNHPKRRYMWELILVNKIITHKKIEYGLE